MIKSLRLSIVLLIILIASSSVSLAGTSPMENNITVEQYIYSLMKVFSIEPSDKSVGGMEAYVKEAENRYWIDMDTPRPLNRPLEKHEMIDLAVTALREKGEVQYGTPSEIHDMVKDFKEVPYRSRIAAVLGVNMGLVKLDEDGNINPFEKVSVEEASKFLMELGKAVRVYPEYDYLTKNYEYETEINGLAHCLLLGSEYGGNKFSNMSIEGLLGWNELNHLEDSSFIYEDIGLTYRKSFKNEEETLLNRSSVIISVYKPGPILHKIWVDGNLKGSRLTFEIDEKMRSERLEMAREISKLYHPLDQIDLLDQFLFKHTSEKYLEDKIENNEKIIIDDMFYSITHSLDKVWIEGMKVSETPDDMVKIANVVR